MQITQSLWHISEDESKVKSGKIVLSDEMCIVESAYSLISLGTELLVARGHIPEELQAPMQAAYMGGDFSLPIKFGYSLTGTLKDSGKQVHVMHPHQDICAVHKSDVFEIPDTIPLKRATLASNLETALNAVWDAKIAPGERVVVVGFGMIGSLISRIISDIPACTLAVSDPQRSRKEYVSDFGFKLLEDMDGNQPFDVAFHCSATAAGLQQALDLVGKEGRVIELSWYGTQSVEISLGGTFHNLRKRIISSQVGSLPPHMTSAWDFVRRKETVFELLKNKNYDLHITHEVTLEEAAELFNRWRTERPEGLGYCIQYFPRLRYL